MTEESAYRLYLRALAALDDDTDEAEDLLRRSLAKESHFKTHHELAKLLLRAGRTDEAERHFEAAHDTNPRNDRAATDYARVLCGGDVRRATQILTGVLSRNSTYGPAKALLEQISATEDLPT